jgi:hypothetical protein
MRVLAIDPGEVHCGVAFFDDGVCTHTEECKPSTLFEHLVFEMLDVVVCEEFRLYPWTAGAQSFSSMATCEVIGVIKYICEQESMPLVMQSATIKKVASAQMKARGVDNLAVVQRKGGHAVDAFLHGWFYINQTKGV